jgi:hypothetical protein
MLRGCVQPKAEAVTAAGTSNTLCRNHAKRKIDEGFYRENEAPTFSRLCVWLRPCVDLCQKPIKNRRSHAARRRRKRFLQSTSNIEHRTKERKKEWSGRRDSNSRPPAPKAGALARLRYVPNQVRKVYLSKPKGEYFLPDSPRGFNAQQFRKIARHHS